jgi:hypothetical protein
MIISEVINLAKYSELASVHVKNNDDAIVAFINLGMIELYTRFPIKVEETVVTLLDNEVYYKMPSNFMYALQAFAETPENLVEQNRLIPINDDEDPLSVFFTDWNTLQVPATAEGAFVAIIYVAAPELITKIQALDGVTHLAIPDSLVDCLLSYIGYRAHMGVKSDSRSENNAHWQRFERNCQKAQDLGVAFPSDSMSMATRVFKRGFL